MTRLKLSIHRVYRDDTPENIAIEMETDLCRCAVEDWLRDHEIFTMFPPDPNDRETGHFVEMDGEQSEWDRRLFNGPTIHDALISAAQTVADDLNFPH